MGSALPPDESGVIDCGGEYWKKGAPMSNELTFGSLYDAAGSWRKLELDAPMSKDSVQSGGTQHFLIRERRSRKKRRYLQERRIDDMTAVLVSEVLVMPGLAT